MQSKEATTNKAEKKELSIVKTFRLYKSLSDKIDLIRVVKDMSLQDIIRDALVDFVEKNSVEAASVDISNMEDVGREKQEYMYIPMKYYSLYNNLNKIEVKKQIADNEIKTITLGGTTFVMIKISESIYKKAELVVLKNNVSNLTQDVRFLKNEMALLKRNIDKR